MNENNLSQILQQSFHIVIGAVASIVETAQNPDKRTEAITQLKMELNQKTREWVIKGEITETEARKTLDNFLRQRNWQQDSLNSNRNNHGNHLDTTDRNDLSFGLQQLKDDIVALRLELARMGKPVD